MKGAGRVVGKGARQFNGRASDGAVRPCRGGLAGREEEEEELWREGPPGSG